MFRISQSRDPVYLDSAAPIDPADAHRRGNQRRLVVFLLVFSLTLLPGLAWNLLRPAEYRANAQVQIGTGVLAPRVERGDAPTPGVDSGERRGPKADLLTQAQILTSRSLLEAVIERLARDGQTLPFAGVDAVAALQNTIVATPVAGTDIVELQAIGESPQLMAKIINTLINTYREQLFATHDSSSKSAIANLRDEVERLGASIAEKRTQLDAFRARSGVVSSERGENEALARIKGLSESLNKANEEAAKADARLRTLRDSAAAGRSPVLSRDNPTLALLEQRISAAREQLRDMERTYTPAFMAMDPNARALKARLAELEQQLASSRSAGLQAALGGAEEGAAGARATVDRLRGQIDGLRREAQVFSGNFQEALAMESDVTRLEEARRNAGERLARLDASESGRLPTLTLIEAASVPQKPWRPDYLRDGLINGAVSFLLGLLAIWFVELFNRPAPPVSGGVTTVLVPHPWGVAPLPALAMEQAVQLAAPASDGMPQLALVPALPRELTQAEVGALLAAADGQARLLCALLLLGLRVDEACALTLGDVDLPTMRLTVRGASARVLPLPDSLLPALAQDSVDGAGQTLLHDAQGQPLTLSGAATRVTCTALDAGLDDAASVSPEALRHTCIAHLMRQNVRFSDLAALAGQIGADELAAYAALSDGGRRVPGDAVDLVMPALRELPAG